jgi:hypothetical protein
MLNTPLDHVTRNPGSTCCIDHFFLTPKLLAQLRSVEVQPLVGNGQPCVPHYCNVHVRIV